MTKILVVYYSMSGNTQAMAEALADGAASVAGTEVVVKQGLEAGEEDLLACHAVALGSPDYFSYMAGGLKDFFDRVYYPTQGQIAGKRCAVFGSAGGPPTKVIESIEHIVWAMKLAPVAPAVGASGKPTDEVLADCRALGEKLAQAARASAA